ncbi:HAD-IA family hydrolase [Thalassotalea ganghwensis]
MKFFRRLLPIKAISFDLDDTLYSNYPVMLATDSAMTRYFSKCLPKQSQAYDHHYWFVIRKQLLQQYPHWSHDVGFLREQVYFHGLKALGFDEHQAQSMASDAMAHFLHHRSNFQVPKSVHQLLEQLRQHYPIVAISNGNVDTEKIGIRDYFTDIFHADLTQKQKPSPDMFYKACQKLGIAARELLHVGDCGRSDIYGAIMAGCQTAWVSSYDVGKPLSILPNCELTDVEELALLVNR